MFSLRSFHLFFILLVIVGADLFGIWAVWRYWQTHDLFTLVLGILCVAGGMGLVVYAVRFVKSMDRSDIR